jgi:hypothetical protein
VKDQDGFHVTAAELAAFRASGKQHWWLNYDGTTNVYTDEYELSPGWPVYLGSVGVFAQLQDDDLQRACDEQLNPALRANAHLLPPAP